MNNDENFQHDLLLIVAVALVILFITGQAAGAPQTSPIVIPSIHL